MVDLIIIAFGVFAVGVFFYGLHKDTKNEIWNSLVSTYKLTSEQNIGDNYRIQMVFLRPYMMMNMIILIR